MSLRSGPLRRHFRHCSHSVVVPVQFSPPTDPRSPFSCHYLIGSRSHWRRSLYHHSFKGTHLGIHIEGGEATRYSSGISSHCPLHFTRNVPSTFSDVWVHTHLHLRLENTITPPPPPHSLGLDRPPPPFCAIAHAGLAGCSSLY
jgi:hypothetical protein